MSESIQVVSGRISDVLFVRGHGVPEDVTLVATSFDGGERVTVRTVDRSSPTGLIDEIELTMAHCKESGARVTGISMAACERPREGSDKRVWSCVSTDNDMNGRIDMLFPVIHEGMPEWLRITAHERTDLVVDMQKVMAAVWSRLFEDGIAELPKELAGEQHG